MNDGAIFIQMIRAVPDCRTCSVLVSMSTPRSMRRNDTAAVRRLFESAGFRCAGNGLLSNR
jgi:hypothetical protein